MVMSYVWSILLYRVEAWMLKTTIINKLDVTNKDIPRRASVVDCELFKSTKRIKTGYLGNILNGECYHFQHLILQGK